MQQQVFKKQYEQSGPNGRFVGEVIVTMNYDKRTITGTHAITHDDYKKEIPIHKVEGFINGKLLMQNGGIANEEEVLIATRNVRKDIIDSVQSLANRPPIKPFAERVYEILNSEVNSEQKS